VDWVELSEEDISQNPGKSTGEVHAHDSTDALSHSKLSHLKNISKILKPQQTENIE
jgi:hypothetical protein